MIQSIAAHNWPGTEMNFLTNADVTEIIKAMVGQNAPHVEQFTAYMTEAAKACVEADRILSGFVNVNEAPDTVSISEPLDRLNDGIKALMDLLDAHKAAKQIEAVRWASLDPESAARAKTERV